MELAALRGPQAAPAGARLVPRLPPLLQGRARAGTAQHPCAGKVDRPARHPADGAERRAPAERQDPVNAADNLLGRAILLVNPPLVDGVAFTRQGRCQERAEVLGTTKPPYSLAVIAALLREHGLDFRLIDQTADNLATEAVIELLDREGFRPSLVVFCSTVPTLVADASEMAKLRRHFGAPIVSFGPHASAAPQASMERAPDVDAMVVGEPEDAVMALAGLPDLEQARSVAGVISRSGDVIVPAEGRSGFAG
ncbi:MAG: hypothetical protein EHM13_04745, partial [Acidobacteria bacterium]